MVTLFVTWLTTLTITRSPSLATTRGPGNCPLTLIMLLVWHNLVTLWYLIFNILHALRQLKLENVYRKSCFNLQTVYICKKKFRPGLKLVMYIECVVPRYPFCKFWQWRQYKETKDQQNRRWSKWRNIGGSCTDHPFLSVHVSDLYVLSVRSEFFGCKG